MIIGRKKRFEVPIDILRLIYNKSLQLSIIILVNGHGQIGKSTFIHYVANRLEHIKRGISRKQATWKEWDWKNNTANDPRRFIELWDSPNNHIIALEEAGEQMNYLDWRNTMSRVFSSTTRTQGLMKKVCFLITPHSRDVSKYNREAIDFKIWVKKRDDVRKYAQVIPRYVKIDYLKDKYRLGWLRNWGIHYPVKFLREANKFTDWLKGFKGDISDKNKKLVGLRPDIKIKFDQKDGSIIHHRPFKLG